MKIKLSILCSLLAFIGTNLFAIPTDGTSNPSDYSYNNVLNHFRNGERDVIGGAHMLEDGDKTFSVGHYEIIDILSVSDNVAMEYSPQCGQAYEGWYCVSSNPEVLYGFCQDYGNEFNIAVYASKKERNQPSELNVSGDLGEKNVLSNCLNDLLNDYTIFARPYTLQAGESVPPNFARYGSSDSGVLTDFIARWTFIAGRPGTTTLTFYHLPADQCDHSPSYVGFFQPIAHAKADRTVTYTITVQDDGLVKQK